MLRNPQMKVQNAWLCLKEGSDSGEMGFSGPCSHGNKAKTPNRVWTRQSNAGMGEVQCGFHTVGPPGLCQESPTPQGQEGTHWTADSLCVTGKQLSAKTPRGQGPSTPWCQNMGTTVPRDQWNRHLPGPGPMTQQPRAPQVGSPREA